jgi:hypothetical protein
VVERTLAAQTKKSTAPDNRVRIGTVQADGSVLVQGALVRCGFLGGLALDAGDPVALVRQDKTWLCLGKVYADHATGMEIQTGIQLISFTAVSSAFVDITFARVFSVLPTVTATINNIAGVSNLWFVRAANVSTTGFRMSVSASVANTWTDIPVSWQAIVPTQ